LLVLIPLTVFLLVWAYRYLTRKTAVKTAKKLLLTLKQNDSKDNAQKLQDLSVLLRRVAISVSPEANVAGLTGGAWLAFLDSSLKDSPFSEGVGRCLGDAPYRQWTPSDGETNELFALCEKWLKSKTSQRKPGKKF